MSNTRYSTLIFAAVMIGPTLDPGFLKCGCRPDHPPPNGFETRGAGSISHPHALSTSQFDHHRK